MWKKEDAPPSTPAPQPEPQGRPDRPAPTAGRSDRATIGRSITIRGEVTGDEDLLIQGRVDGSVDLKQHSITIGAEGDVKASVHGRLVIVEGRVEGDIRSDEQVILRSSATVLGDIVAPRLVLEDGAHFRGGVDMGEGGRGGSTAKSAPPAEVKRSGNTPSSSTPNAANVPGSTGDKGKGAEVPAEARA